MGTPETAGLPALVAAVGPTSRDGGFYGPQSPGSAGGPPGETALWRPMVREDAARLWDTSNELAGVTFN